MELRENERRETINDSLTIVQDVRHLAFGTDALLLAGSLSYGKRAAELGAGSGAVSLLAAKRKKFTQIDAVEILEDAADLCRRNVLENDLSGVVSVHRLDLRALPAQWAGRYDCVFSNPPYMKTGQGKACAQEARQSARHETAGGVEDFCRCAAKLLKYGGQAHFVYRPDRLTDLLCAMRESGIEPKRVLIAARDEAHAPFAALVCGVRGGKPGLFFAPPFLLFDREGKETPAYAALLKEGNFDERFQRP